MAQFGSGEVEPGLGEEELVATLSDAGLDLFSLEGGVFSFLFLLSIEAFRVTTLVAGKTDAELLDVLDIEALTILSTADPVEETALDLEDAEFFLEVDDSDGLRLELFLE